MAESYLFARHHMYQTVYFHKATRAAEVMLRVLFKRYRQLLKGNDNPNATVLPQAPPPLKKAFSGTGEIALDDYLALDDAVLTEFFGACAACGDLVLQTLGRGIRNRQLLKGVEVPGDAGPKLVEFVDAAKKILVGAGVDTDFLFVPDTPTDTPYKEYDFMEKEDPGQLYVEDHIGQILELSQLAKPVAELRAKITQIRYYYPKEHRAEIDKIAHEQWRRNP